MPGSFDPGRLGARSESGDTRFAQGIGDTEDQRHLRPDDDEIGLDLPGQRHDRLAGGDVDGVVGGDGRGARVTGGHVQVGDRRVTSESEEQGMFAAARADHEYAHGDDSTVRTAQAPVDNSVHRGSSRPGRQYSRQTRSTGRAGALMADIDDLDARLTAVENRLDDVDGQSRRAREDSAAARVLAGAADRTSPRCVRNYKDTPGS